MAGSNFPRGVRHVQPGEAVAAGVANRPTKDLEARTNYLREGLAAIEEGRLLLWKNQRVAPEVQEGQAVYWNAQTQQYEQALAAVEVDQASGTLVPKPSSDCTGLCHRKHAGGVMADIAVGGVAWYHTLAAAIDGPVLPGRYYLSAQDPGMLTQQKPPITVPVAVVFGPTDACDENTWVFIMPQLRDFLENHIHYRFELVPRPAGRHAPPLPGEPHEIQDPDPMLQGWLPATEEFFPNMDIPRGAKFGYNLARHPQLARVWPPIPLESAVLFWDKGHEHLGATEIPTHVKDGIHRLAIMDRRGIWWMSDCYGDVPWPTAYDNTGSETLPESLSSEFSEPGGCPRVEEMRIILAFLHMLFTTERTVVTSLQPDVDQPIEFVNCDGVPANTGDLWARLIISALLDPDEYAGGRAFKRLLGPGLRFGLGWMAEGLVAGSDYVLLSSDHQRLLDPAAEAGPDNPTVHQGVVRVDINLDPAERELPPQIVRLGDALERLHKNVPYIGFPNGRDSGVRLRMNVPSVGLPSSPRMKIRTMIFGRASGYLPAMTMSYQRIARPTADVPTPLVEGDTTLTYPIASLEVTADGAIEVESAEFPVAPGDTVLVSIERASTSGYDDGEVGLIRAAGVIVQGG